MKSRFRKGMQQLNEVKDLLRRWDKLDECGSQPSLGERECRSDSTGRFAVCDDEERLERSIEEAVNRSVMRCLGGKRRYRL